MNSNESTEPQELKRIKEFLYAAKTGKLKTIDSILQQKILIDATDPTDPLGNTALHLATENGHADIVLKLLQQGADVKKKRYDKHERTPLHLAAANGHTEVIKILLDHGAEIDAVGTAGMTALYRAATKNRLEVVRTLLLYDADIYKTDNLLGMTSLQSAILRKNREIAKLLTIYASFNLYLHNQYINLLVKYIKENYVKNSVDLSLKKANLNEYLTQQINSEALSLWENNKIRIQENLQNALLNKMDIVSYLEEAKTLLLECFAFRISKKIFNTKL